MKLSSTWAVTAAAMILTAGCQAIGQPGHAPEPEVISRASLAEVEFLADPLTWKGPSTAVLADRSIHPVAKDPEQKTKLDTSRVVAMDMSGSIAATIWGLGFGDSLVGRDVAAEFPGTEDLPVVTKDGHSINVEAVINLRPTLVITDGSIGPRDVVEQLRDVGITVEFLDKKSTFAGSSQLARDVAAVYGAPEAGEKLAEKIDADTERVTQLIERKRTGDRMRMIFLYLRGSAGIYYLLGDEAGASDLIDHLGGVNVAREQGWSELTPMTDEAIMTADPDLVLVMTDGIKSVGGLDALLTDRPALALTPAAKNRRFVDMRDADMLSFGPRAAAVLDALARAVYAPDAK